MMAKDKVFRKGANGALMDEYERAAMELQKLIETISDGTYARLMDARTEDENCRSIQTIMSHVVSAGYSYADSFRKQFGISSARPEKRLLTRSETLTQMTAILKYMNETLENRWEMTEDQISGMTIHSSWGVVYDMEQMFEHAIVHVLRHRRQIEKFLQK
jgi:uncharacterized damage-inducible protein DinB